MDIDAELERLSREARAKLDAERSEGPAAPAPAAKGVDDALDREIAAQRAAKAAERPDEAGERPAARHTGSLRRPKSLPLGAKLVVGAAAVVSALVIFNVVLLPLLKAALVIGVLLVAALLVLKLMGVDMGGDEDEPPA